jgi:uncharacterized protein
MKFTRELPAKVNFVRAYQLHSVRIGEQVLSNSCLFNANELIADWGPRSVAQLTPEHFAAVLAWEPEIVLLGTGPKQAFPARNIYAALLARGVGFEVMDNGAACRTYNVLVSEDRRVAAGLLF